MKRFLTILAIPLLLLSSANAAIGYFPGTKEIEWFTGENAAVKGGHEQYKFSKDGKILSYDLVTKDGEFLATFKYVNNELTYMNTKGTTMEFDAKGNPKTYVDKDNNTILAFSTMKDGDGYIIAYAGKLKGKEVEGSYDTKDKVTQVENGSVTGQIAIIKRIGRDMAMQGLIMRNMMMDKQKEKDDE